MVTDHPDLSTSTTYPLPLAPFLSHTNSRSTTPSGTVLPTPPSPVLLNVLGAGDEESILVLVVEEDEDQEEGGGGEGGEEPEQQGSKNGISITINNRSRTGSLIHTSEDDGDRNGDDTEKEGTKDQDERAEADRQDSKRKRAGRVYAGSQGGDIHVRRTHICPLLSLL